MKEVDVVGQDNEEAFVLHFFRVGREDVTNFAAAAYGKPSHPHSELLRDAGSDCVVVE